MSNKAIIRVILVVFILFFGLRFLSHTFLFLGQNSDNEPDPGKRNFLKLSGLFFPIDARPPGEYAFVLLKENELSPDPRVLAESISYFKRSLDVNMFYYNSHLNLGKAYIYRNILDHTSYDQAMAAFKRAAVIRGYNARVSLDTLTVLLSMWPFLPEEDKAFCSTLLGKSIKRLSREGFNSLLEIWALYSRDVAFFKGVLEKVPHYYLAVAKKLLHMEINMSARRDFLLKYAAYTFTNLKNLYRQYLSQQPPGLREKLKKLLGRLGNQKVMGYYLINPVSKSDEEKYKGYEKEIVLNQKKYFDLQKGIIRNILELLFAKGGWKKDKKTRSELDTFIRFCIGQISSIDQLNEFNDYLTKKEYFTLSTSSLEIFYIEQSIKFKSGQYETVISNIGNLISNVAYVKKEDMKDYADVLLLLTDAYISFRLLLRAMETIKMIEIHDYNITDIYWRKMQIERVIGAEGEDEDELERKKEQYEFIRGSSRIRLNSPAIKKTVYLIKNYEKENEKQIEIQLGDSLKKRIKDFHLLRVIKDGRLFYETYLSRLEFPFKVPILIEEKYSKYILHIELL